MPTTIRSGENPPYEVAVNEQARLKTTAVGVAPERAISENEKELYRMSALYTITGAGTFTLLSIYNADSLNRDLHVFDFQYQWWGLAGGAAFPNGNTYVTLMKDATYSGGSEVDEIINLNLGVSRIIPATLLRNDPTVVGTPKLGWKNYLTVSIGVADGELKGALLIPKGVSLGVRMVTDQTSGVFNLVGTIGFHTPGID